METNQDSVESQLPTRCNVQESQVETLEKQKSKSPEKFVRNDDAQTEKLITVRGRQIRVRLNIVGQTI